MISESLKKERELKGQARNFAGTPTSDIETSSIILVDGINTRNRGFW